MNDRHKIKPYPLRLDPAFRARLEQEAKDAGRSLHAEILKRLESSLEIKDSVLNPDLNERLWDSAVTAGRTVQEEIEWRINASFQRGDKLVGVIPREGAYRMSELTLPYALYKLVQIMTVRELASADQIAQIQDFLMEYLSSEVFAGHNPLKNAPEQQDEAEAEQSD